MEDLTTPPPGTESIATLPGRRPYSPSSFDRLMDAVEQLPLAYWATYLILFAIFSTLLHAAAWLDGTTSPFTLQPVFVLVPFRIAAPLMLMTYLDRVAIDALAAFRPLLNPQENESRLRYQLTTMPALPALLAGLLWMLYFVILALYSPIEEFKGRPLLTPMFLLAGSAAYALGGVFYYHTWHQLRLVHRIHAGVHAFNLFRLAPVFAFSRLTARTGAIFLLLISLTYILFPYPLTDIRALASYLLQILLATLAFVLPLWPTHQRLAAEKRRLQDEAGVRMKEALQRLHAALGDSDPGRLSGIKTAVESLLLERKVLDEIPTWPWQPATFRGVLTALFLPLLLLIVQQVLELWFVP
jgi:hypothetical protein